MNLTRAFWGVIVSPGLVGCFTSYDRAPVVADMTDADFRCVLGLPEMQEVVDYGPEGRGERLTPSCDESGLGEAFPPRRIVELLRELGNAGARTTVQSICESDYTPALMELLAGLLPRESTN